MSPLEGRKMVFCFPVSQAWTVVLVVWGESINSQIKPRTQVPLAKGSAQELCDRSNFLSAVRSGFSQHPGYPSLSVPWNSVFRLLCFPWMYEPAAVLVSPCYNSCLCFRGQSKAEGHGPGSWEQQHRLLAVSLPDPCAPTQRSFNGLG